MPRSTSANPNAPSPMMPERLLTLNATLGTKPNATSLRRLSLALVRLGDCCAATDEVPRIIAIRIRIGSNGPPKVNERLTLRRSPRHRYGRQVKSLQIRQLADVDFRIPRSSLW